MTEPKEPTPGDPDDDRGLTGMIGRASAAALRPVARWRRGQGALTDEAERAIDGVMAGPLPEAVGRSLVEHRVVERVVTEVLEAPRRRGTAARRSTTGQVEQLVREVLENPRSSDAVEAIHSRLTTELAERDHAEPGIQADAHERALQPGGSPRLRAADRRPRRRSAAASRHARQADESVEASVRRLAAAAAGRRVPGAFAGSGREGWRSSPTRCWCVVFFVVGGALIGLVASLFGELRPMWLVGRARGSRAGRSWSSGYFVGFWSTVGQTPGMRMMHVRVSPGPGRRLRLAFPPPSGRPGSRGHLLFTGFLPALVDSRRRALQDFLAGTTVVYARSRAAGPAPNPAMSTPSSLDSTLESRWDEVAGVRVHAHAGGEGPPVVLVHGYGVSGRYMLPLARVLAARCSASRPTSRVTDRANGRARRRDRRPRRRARGPGWTRSGWSGPAFVANSMGCQIVTNWRYGGRSGSARWCSSAQRSTRAGGRPATRSSARYETRRMNRRCSWRSPAGSGLAATSVSSGPSARSVLADRIEERLPAIEQPTVVVHGEKDGVVSREWAEQAAACYPVAASSSSPASPTPSPTRKPASSPGSSRS